MNNPKCFVSYSWDSPTHKDWVCFEWKAGDAYDVEIADYH